MPIVFEDNGFIFWEDASWTPSLGMDSDKLPECVSETKRRGLKGAFGTVPYFRESNLHFLRQLPWLRATQFWDVKLDSLSGLYGLGGLEFLRVSGKRPALAFEKLSSLRQLVWDHQNSDTGLDALEDLEMMHLWRYRAEGAGSFRLRLPESLTELRIFWSDIETLDGLGPLPKLATLELGRCRYLKSLGPLAESCPNLEQLLVTASGRLTAEEAKRASRGHPTLRRVFAANKLLLDRSGD
ncbi:MAG: hypothetical protein MJA83_13810 [Gammaproteobacteria bacterium]|nr:hypothetical protein [Gammaproteobacteria bacterium]